VWPSRGAQDRLNRTGLPAAAYALTALLAASVVLLLFGREGSRTNPTIESSRPSGLRAAAEVLRAAGYRVVQDTSSRPRLSGNDLVVVVEIDDWQALDRPPDSPERRAFGMAMRHVEAGGAGIRLTLPGDFDAASRRMSDEIVEARNPYRQNDPPIRVLRGLPDLPFEPSGRARVSLLRAGTGPLAEDWAFISPDAGPRAVRIAEAMSLTNRYIDRAGHAIGLLKIVNAIAHEGGRVVFAEATFGNVREPSLAAELGPWMVALQWQFGLLFLVVAYSLGKRFGLPQAGRVREQGAMESVDAFATLMMRARRPGLALHLLADRAEARARAALRLPREAPLTYMGIAPAALLEALAIAREGEVRWTVREAASHAARIQAIVEEIERSRSWR
jgi:hypothetical protein